MPEQAVAHAAAIKRWIETTDADCSPLPRYPDRAGAGLPRTKGVIELAPTLTLHPCGKPNAG